MSTIHPTAFLRNVLLLDAAASGATGLVLIAGAGLLDGLLGLPVALMREAGLILVPYVAFVAWVGTREEIADIGVEPNVVAAGRPQPERTIGALPRQQPVDRFVNTLVHGGVERQMGLARELIDVEQRHGAAGDLFRTTERIAIERRQERCGVERRREADRERNAAGSRHQVREQVA